jgi:hypothetical protein
MKKWIILLVALLIVGAAVCYLPWWITLGLVAIIVMPVLCLVVALLAITRTLKGELSKQFADFLPKKMERKLAAGEEYADDEFQFRFPVACDVSRTTVQDFEALMIKPKVHAKGQVGDSMLIVSTIPQDEMKTNVSEKLDDVFSKIEEVRTGEFQPLVIGPLSGESRTFEASKDGKSVRGESAYLGLDTEDEYSVAWQIITERDAFDAVAAKYRELAKLVHRVTD